MFKEAPSRKNKPTVEERWRTRVGEPRTTVTPSYFPPEASAIIYQPTRSPLTSSRRRSPWKLAFVQRSAKYTEPLMGWTGNDDPLAQVELIFPSAAAAVRYARRNGIPFVLSHRKQQAAMRPRLVTTCNLADGAEAVPLTRQLQFQRDEAGHTSCAVVAARM